MVKTADLDSPDPRCMVPYDASARPTPDKLELALAKPATIQSGDEKTFVLLLENKTKKPIVVPAAAGCSEWQAEAISRSGASSYVIDAGIVCGEDKMARYMLLPGGALKKSIRFRASRFRLAATEQNLGPLRPGAYTLSVELPWSHNAPTKGDPSATEPDEFSAPLRVTRRPRGAKRRLPAWEKNLDKLQ